MSMILTPTQMRVHGLQGLREIGGRRGNLLHAVPLVCVHHGFQGLQAVRLMRALELGQRLCTMVCVCVCAHVCAYMCKGG